jgi:hypothetical protein
MTQLVDIFAIGSGVAVGIAARNLNFKTLTGELAFVATGLLVTVGLANLLTRVIGDKSNHQNKQEPCR